MKLSKTILASSAATVFLSNYPLTMAADADTHSTTKLPEALQSVAPPTGVTFTGTSEAITFPNQQQLQNLRHESDERQNNNNQEWFGGHGGWGRWGGYGGWGRGWGGYGGWGGYPGWGGLGLWGGFGPFRYGFTHGGLPGWAYPLSYWNAFGAGLYGGSCGLGQAFGGLYYC